MGSCLSLLALSNLQLLNNFLRHSPYLPATGIR
jgi:hypothetical protein